MSQEYWGRFTVQPHQIRELERQAEVIPMPRGEMFLAACSNILRHGHGFVAATDADVPKDAQGGWIPLFTYPCIEYLRQFDLRRKRVFEWGAGASTLYWMTRAESVTSVENNRMWFERMSAMKNEAVRLILEETDRFPFRIGDEAGVFDLIVIDSFGYRFDCATEAVKKLAPGGMIILDNSDWHPMTAEALKRSGLIQVDFSGFKVTESHTSTTSVFLHRDFDFPTLESTQPAYCIGAKRLMSEWDRPYAKRPAD